jgi:Electron transfer flavoprotein domain
VKIVVCLHAPRAGADGVRPTTLSPDDARALALGRAFGGDHTLTAVLPGLAADEEPLRHALAAGATRALRVVGEDFGTADFHTLGQALATAIKRVGVDLVLMGARSEDESLDAVPASVARHTGALHVACVEDVTAGDDGTVELTVRGGGKVRRLRVPVPAVLSVVAAAGAGPEATPPVTAAATPGTALPAIEVLSLVDPEATVVRRRTELLGQPELASRPTETVTSAAALVAALVR